MKEEIKKDEIEITPSQYFETIKDAKNKITLEEIKDSYPVFIKLAEKYVKTGQVNSLKKLNFLSNVLIQEEKLIGLGVDTFIYRDVIEEYIRKVTSKVVKIIELSRYTREIPEEIVEVIEKTKDIFDEMYIVFTDYTGLEEKKVEKERRDKDPILFGVFTTNEFAADRCYFLGDWVDEYCDLTLDKMITEYKEKIGDSPALTPEIKRIPKTTEDLINVLKTYEIKEKKGKTDLNADPVNSNLIFTTSNKPVSKPSFFSKVRSIFHK